MKQICLFLCILAFFVSCTPNAFEEESTSANLTVTVCTESTTPQNVYPLQVIVRTSDTGETKGSETVENKGQSVAFTLPNWMRYQVIVKSNSGSFASAETVIRDQPVTLYLKLSGTGNTTPSGNDTINISLDDTTQVITPVERPKVLSLYNNHIVVFSDSISSDSAKLTLLSLYEWTELPSANNTSDSLKAIHVADGYQEFGLSNWQIPTVEEVKRLKTAYGSESVMLDSLNALLLQQDASVITLKNGSDNVRYLCDKGHKTFSFVSGTNVINGGTKVSIYHMRLVRTLRIKVK